MQSSFKCGTRGFCFFCDYVTFVRFWKFIKWEKFTSLIINESWFLKLFSHHLKLKIEKSTLKPWSSSGTILTLLYDRPRFDSCLGQYFTRNLQHCNFFLLSTRIRFYRIEFRMNLLLLVLQFSQQATGVKVWSIIHLLSRFYY